MNAGVRDETSLSYFRIHDADPFRHDNILVGTAYSMVWRSGSSIYRVSATKIFLDFATIMRIPRIKRIEQAITDGFQGVSRVA